MDEDQENMRATTGVRQKMPSGENVKDERTVVAPNTGGRWLTPPGHDGSGGRGEGRGSDRGRNGR